MSNLTSIIFSLILLLTSCVNSADAETKAGNKLLEDPQHHIENSSGILKQDSAFLYTGWYYLSDTPNGYKRQLDKSTEIYFLDRTPITTAKNFTTLEIYESSQKYLGLAMRLDEEGTKIWSIATQRSVGKQLAFILDNKLLQVAKVNSQIKGGMTALNRGDYSKEELENFKTIIESER